MDRQHRTSQAKLTNAPSLQKNAIRLRPLNPNDFRMLFEWHSRADELAMWWTDRRRMAFPDFVEDLEHRLRGSIFIFLMIDKLHEGEVETVGFTYAYQVNLIDRYAYVCTYLRREFTGQGIGPIADLLFAEYLFATYGFRKLYAEIYGYNEVSLKTAQRHGFVEEGRLKAHRWFRDRFWDVHILSITRERFDEIRQSISS